MDRALEFADPLYPEAAAALTAEALRLHERYTLEVVEAFSICPFARGARLAGRTRCEVLLTTACETAPVAEAIARLEAGPPEVELVQLLFPRVGATAREFDDFVARVRAEREARTTRPVFAMASFHPDYGCDTTAAETLIPFFRRTPDPSIQLVRAAVLDALAREAGPRGATRDEVERFLRGAGPPPATLSAWIAGENFARVQRDGPGAIAAVYAAIAEDRRESYARVTARFAAH